MVTHSICKNYLILPREKEQTWSYTIFDKEPLKFSFFLASTHNVLNIPYIGSSAFDFLELFLTLQAIKS